MTVLQHISNNGRAVIRGQSVYAPSKCNISCLRIVLPHPTVGIGHETSEIPQIKTTHGCHEAEEMSAN